MAESEGEKESRFSALEQKYQALSGEYATTNNQVRRSVISAGLKEIEQQEQSLDEEDLLQQLQKLEEGLGRKQKLERQELEESQELERQDLEESQELERQELEESQGTRLGH
ncbi:MAG: hypothetical protein ACR2JB_11930 [Bryobacteraceae bacterium]